MPSRDLLIELYAEHASKPFFLEIVDFMSSGAVVAAVVEGVRVIEGVMRLCGSTDATAAPSGTVRGDLGHDWGRGATENVIHRSDSPESACREIKMWFPQL